MEIKGINGTATASEDHVSISRKTVGGVLMQGIKGDKKIYYKDLVSVEFKKPSKLANGYIQFVVNPELAVDQKVGLLATTKEASEDPNAITLRAFTKKAANEAEDFYNYVMEKLASSKQQQSTPTSGTDDLRNLKALLDDGIITQEDFDAKKKELLGL